MNRVFSSASVTPLPEIEKSGRLNSTELNSSNLSTLSGYNITRAVNSGKVVHDIDIIDSESDGLRFAYRQKAIGEPTNRPLFGNTAFTTVLKGGLEFFPFTFVVTFYWNAFFKASADMKFQDKRTMAQQFLMHHIRNGWPYADRFYRPDMDAFSSEQRRDVARIQFSDN
uniref:Ntox44 domain-containing protein n=1 Tax=Angiostrongylus cantonensis TaxID=6313 RepID=A0A0K0DLC8_ANGCA